MTLSIVLCIREFFGGQDRTLSEPGEDNTVSGATGDEGGMPHFFCTTLSDWAKPELLWAFLFMYATQAADGFAALSNQ